MGFDSMFLLCLLIVLLPGIHSLPFVQTFAGRFGHYFRNRIKFRTIYNDDIRVIFVRVM